MKRSRPIRKDGKRMLPVVFILLLLFLRLPVANSYIDGM
jgi:hypothetical protein